jgi:hypothetical protein
MPPHSGSQPQIDEPSWETCEIVWAPSRLDKLTEAVAHMFVRHPGRFVAKLTTTAREVFLAETQYFPNCPPTKFGAGRYIDDMVTKLEQQGWEETTDRGPEWFNLRFRRRRPQPGGTEPAEDNGTTGAA